MGMAAEPRPASLPLPGGREGATVRLQPLLVATMTCPPALGDRAEGKLAVLGALGVGVKREDYEAVPVVAFLVEHPGAGAILIDTGFHGSVAIDSGHAMGPDRLPRTHRAGSGEWRCVHPSGAATAPRSRAIPRVASRPVGPSMPKPPR